MYAYGLNAAVAYAVGATASSRCAVEIYTHTVHRMSAADSGSRSVTLFAATYTS
jgi:hypothetical protein